MSSGNEHEQLPADEQNELNPRHKRPIQETELPGEEFVDISRDEGAKVVLGEALVSISSSLSRCQLGIYILAVSTLNVLLQSIEKLKDFKDVFYLLEEKMPTEAVSMTMKSLSRLGKNYNRLLQPFVKDDFVIQDHYDTDFVLTLGVILGNMSEEGYMSFMELARREYFSVVHPDNLKDRAKLVGKLLWDGKTEEKDLHNYFKWIASAGYHSQLKVLKEFCERHGIEVPELNYKEDIKWPESPLLVGAVASSAGAGSEGGGARQLKNGSNKPEEKDCRVNNRNSEVAPLLSTSTSDTSSDSHPNNNTCNKPISCTFTTLLCAIVLILTAALAIGGLVPVILYEFTETFASIEPNQSTLAVNGNYVSLHYTTHHGIMFQYTALSFSLQSPFNRTTSVDIYCVKPDQLHSVKRKGNFAILSSDRNVSQVPFLDRTYFSDCHYPGKCILRQFIYQAKTSVSALIFDITLNNFTADTYVNASIFDNFDDFQNFLHDKQQFNMVKNTRLNQQNFRLILEEAQMRRSSYYFIALEDVVRTSTWFTMEPSGLHVYYNASSHPVCCTMNTTNNYTCSFSGIRDDSVTYLARVRDDVILETASGDPLYNYITSSVSAPSPTDTGNGIIWGCYGTGVVVAIVVLIVARWTIRKLMSVHAS